MLTRLITSAEVAALLLLHTLYNLDLEYFFFNRARGVGYSTLCFCNTIIPPTLFLWIGTYMKWAPFMLEERGFVMNEV